MAKIICLSEQKKSYSDTYVIFCGKAKCRKQIKLKIGSIS